MDSNESLLRNNLCAQVPSTKGNYHGDKLDTFYSLGPSYITSFEKKEKLRLLLRSKKMFLTT